MRNTQLFKKAYRPLLASSVLVLALTSAPAGVIAQDAPLQGNIRFSWWGSQARNEKTDRIIQLFEQENPGVKIEREAADFNPHWEKLTIQSAAGNQPCAIQMQTRWLATFAKPNILMPLDELFADGAFNVEGIAQPIIDSSKGADGHLYMIPSGVFYFALMYNKSMADAAAAAGVAPLGETYTWTQFADYLRAVKPHLPEGVNASHNMGRETDAFVTWVQSQGQSLFEGSQVTFTAEVAQGWFDYWETLRQEGLTDSPEEMVSDNGSLVEESNLANARTFVTNRPPNRLGSMQAVIETVSPGSQLDIMPYPTGDDGTVGMDLGANGIAIGATCAPELIPATVAWINFFTQDPRAAEIYQSDNGVVAVDALAEAEATNPNTVPSQVRHIELYRQVVDAAKPVAWPAGGYQAVTDTIARAYDAVAYEQMSSAEAAEQFIAELQEQVNNAAN
jgi:multiple sugar transport system substrate-binding protein